MAGLARIGRDFGTQDVGKDMGRDCTTARNWPAVLQLIRC